MAFSSDRTSTEVPNFSRPRFQWRCRLRGSEIVMAFDECLPGDVGIDETRRSLELTLRWAKRSKDRFDQLQFDGSDTGHVAGSEQESGDQALFGIVQGAGHMDLRME